MRKFNLNNKTKFTTMLNIVNDFKKFRQMIFSD